MKKGDIILKCNNCGSIIPDDVLSCPFCDTQVNLTSTEIANEQDLSIKKQENVEYFQINSDIDALLGRRYKFKSPKNGSILGRINYNIEVAKDCLVLDSSPKSKCKTPVITFDNISGVQLSKIFNRYSILCCVALAIGSIIYSEPRVLILIPGFLFLGYCTRIQIFLRNGKVVTIHSVDADLAVKFKQDIQKLTRSR